MTNTPSPETLEDKQRTALPWLRRRLWIPLVILGVAFGVRALAADFDSAWATVTVVLLSVISVATLASKWFRKTGTTGRWVFSITGMALSAVLLLSFRIDTFSGNMWPKFEPRWLTPHDESLNALSVTGQEIGLSRSTPGDFPQFLGPLRDNSVPHVRLDPDWKSHPPRRLWKRSIGAGWGGFSVVNGYAVTMEQRGPVELVVCYDIETGEPHWSHSEKLRHESLLGGIGPRSTPTIDQGQVFALGATGVLRCLDGASGNAIWQFDLLAHYGISPAEESAGIAWGRSASPLVTRNLVIIPAGGSPQQRVSLVALNRTNGRIVWEGGDSQVSYASPSLVTLAGVPQILIVNESTVTAHAPDSGKLLWSHPWEGSSSSNASVSQALAATDSTVLLSKGYGIGAEYLQLEMTDKRQIQVHSLWASSRVLKTKFTNACLYDGYAYGLSDGVLECVEISSGRRTWKRGRFGHGQLLRAGDHLLIQAESGEIVLVEANSTRFKKIGSIPALEGQTWNNLCLYENRLLVRNAREATCFSLAIQP